MTAECHDNWLRVCETGRLNDNMVKFVAPSLLEYNVSTLLQTKDDNPRGIAHQQLEAWAGVTGPCPQEIWDGHASKRLRD